MAREIMCHLNESPIMGKDGHLNEFAGEAYLIVTGEPAKINHKSPKAIEIQKHFAIEWRINAKTAAYTIHNSLPIFWKMIV